jgi:uncharacterized protein (TIGR02246 family)
MKIRILLIVGFAFSAAALTAQGQFQVVQPGVEQGRVISGPIVTPTTTIGKASSEDSDLVAIRKLSLAFEEAFNSADAKSVAALWKHDGDYIDDSGQVYAGRDAIEKQYAEFFANQKGHRIRVIIDSLRVLGDNVAIEDGRTVLEPAPAGAPATGKYTVVHVKVDGQWLMSTVRDARIEAVSGWKNVSDLEWLIGTWVAEEHGVKMESVCRWVANKSFVERKYTVTQPDQTTTSGVQLIGFNAQQGHVQSWDFGPDGGHATGAWVAHQGGWTANMRGVTGDGFSTSSVNMLTRLDDNAYVWKSFQRRVGNTELPETDEIVMRRQ